MCTVKYLLDWIDKKWVYIIRITHKSLVFENVFNCPIWWMKVYISLPVEVHFCFFFCLKIIFVFETKGGYRHAHCSIRRRGLAISRRIVFRSAGFSKQNNAFQSVVMHRSRSLLEQCVCKRLLWFFRTSSFTVSDETSSTKS